MNFIQANGDGLDFSWLKKIISEKDESYFFYVEGDTTSKVHVYKEDGSKQYICSSSVVGQHQPITLSAKCDAEFRLVHIPFDI